jgi:hypothetical protein
VTKTLGETNETDNAKERRQNQREFYVGNMHMNGVDHQSLFLYQQTKQSKNYLFWLWISCFSSA